MRILAGVPEVVHREIAMPEAVALQELGVEVVTSDYGNSNAVKGIVGRMKVILQNAFELALKAKKNKSEILYLNTAFDERTVIRDIITALIVRLSNRNIKIVLKLHGSMEHVVLAQSGIIAKLKNYLIQTTDLLLLLSKDEKNNFLRAGVSNSKLKTTGNVLNKSLYKTASFIKSQLSENGKYVVLLFVGRLMQEKGISDLIEACKRLKQRGVQYKLYCLGDGPAKDEVLEKIELYKLRKDVIMTGYISEAETKEYYSNCDILILPTYYNEGFPMAVFQAVAAGKPVITTKIRACADHLVEGENCLWCEKQNPEDLARQIERLSLDKMLQETMGSNNLHLAEKFSKERLGEKLLGYFEEILYVKAPSMTHEEEMVMAAEEIVV